MLTGERSSPSVSEGVGSPLPATPNEATAQSHHSSALLATMLNVCFCFD